MLTEWPLSQVTLFLQHDSGEGRREFASAAESPDSVVLDLSYREPDQLAQLKWVGAPAQINVNATVSAAAYDVRVCDGGETSGVAYDIGVCVEGTPLATDTEDDLEYAELPAVASLYELESTPRVLAVDPDTGPSVGGLLTTLTIDLGTARVPGRPLDIQSITLVGSPCDLGAYPGVTGVLTSIEVYHGKRPGYFGDWVDPVDAQGNIYQIKCVTGSYNGGRVDWGHTGRGFVHVLTNLGVAAYSVEAPYQFIDYWSSPTTWTDGILPRYNDAVFSA